jgi:hypothetical protein
MSKMLDWLSAVVAGLTCAAPQSGVLGDPDRVPPSIAWKDLGRPCRPAKVNRDAGLCRGHNDPGAR